MVITSVDHFIHIMFLIYLKTLFDLDFYITDPNLKIGIYKTVEDIAPATRVST